jgi:hypothetical protein
MSSGTNEPPPNPVQSALRGAFGFVRLVDSYKRYLYDNIRPNPILHKDNEYKRNRHYEIIADVGSISALALIWRFSEFSRSELGRPPPSHLSGVSKGIVTRQSLGQALQETDRANLSFNSPQMYIQRARRLVEAATTYGLVETEVESSRVNLKPLRGTQGLHQLMIYTFDGYATPNWLSGDAWR